MTRYAVLALFLVAGCTIGDDVALTKSTITWPFQGGLDTKRGPLSQASGSNTLVQDVRQERLGEWKRRDGFSQGAADTLPEAAPFMFGTLGDAGLLEMGTSGMADYQPSRSAGRWSSETVVGQPTQRTVRGLFSADPVGGSSLFIGVAQSASLAFVGSRFNSAGNNLKLAVVDLQSGAMRVVPNGLSTSITAVQGAATATKLVMVAADRTSGNVYVYVADVATGAASGPVTITSDFNAGGFQGQLAVRSYGGDTVTIAYVTTGALVRFIEYNAVSGALATNTTIGALAAVAEVGLLDDPTGSGVRFLGVSAGANTRMVRLSSAGAVLTNDIAEGVASGFITGVATESGAGWNLIYMPNAGGIRMNYKSAGVVGTAADCQGYASWTTGPTTVSVGSVAWAEPNGTAYWRVLLQMEGNAADPQSTWIEMQFPTGAASNIGQPVSTPASQSGAPVNYLPVVRVDSKTVVMGLPVQVVYEDNAGVIVRHYSVSLFQQRYLTGADVGVQPTGQPAPYKNTSYVPAGQLSFYDEGKLIPLGTRTLPAIPVVTPSVGAGALTPSKQYGYQWVIEQLNSDGDVWRSPPSQPLTLTMSATQNTNTVVLQTYPVDTVVSRSRAALYRTLGNTSAFRRIYSKLFTPGDTITYVDLLSDTAISSGDFIYTTGEIPNSLTPPAAWVAFALDRQWVGNREYPTEISYSKNLRPGRLPEYNDVMTEDLDDDFGPTTNGLGLNDKLIVFKESAVYTVAGVGFDDGGGGQDFQVTRISTDMGAIPGSPVLGLGDEAYFVSKRGICMVSSASNTSFIGSPVDAYLNQPQIQTPETVRSIVYSARFNEVRFMTNASILVYSRTYGIWMRFVGGLATGSPLLHSVMVNDRQWITREDGTVYVEGDASQLTDGTTSFDGELRSPYMVPNGPEGRLRLYEGRAVAQRTSGGGNLVPTLSIFFDYDDSTEITFQPDTPVKATDATYRFEGRPNVLRQKCNAFALGLTFPAGDSTWRLERWGAVVGSEQGYSRGVSTWSGD